MTHATETELLAAIEPKSDQLNADDLIGGPMDVQVAGTSSYRDQGQTRVAIHIQGMERAWKPPKTVLRLLIAAWGKDSHEWVGRWVRLYRDSSVRFGGQEVGGIRVSHLSHLDKPLTVKLTSTRGKRAAHTVQPLQPPTTTRKTLAEVLEQGGLTLADFDRWASSKGKKPHAEMTEAERDKAAAWLSGDLSRLDLIAGGGEE